MLLLPLAFCPKLKYMFSIFEYFMCLPSGGLCSSVTGNGLNDLKLGGHFSLHMRIISPSDNILENYSLIKLPGSFLFQGTVRSFH